MSREHDNKNIVRELWAAAQTEDFEATLEKIYAPDVVYHGPDGDRRTGRNDVIDLVRMYREAFPDLSFEVDKIVAEGEFVVSRVIGRGTHEGELLGIAPTHKKMEVRWIMNMMRLADGQVVEEWEVFDQLGFMEQLGQQPRAAAKRPKKQAKRAVPVHPRQRARA